MAKQLPIPPKETKKNNSFQARRAEGGILSTAFPLLTGTVDFAKSDNKKETAKAFGKDVFANAFPITSWLFGIKNDNLENLRKKNTNEKNAQLTTANEDLFGSSQKLYVEQNKILREIIEEVKSKSGGGMQLPSLGGKGGNPKSTAGKGAGKGGVVATIGKVALGAAAGAAGTVLTGFAAGTGEITLNSAIPKYAGGIGPVEDPRAATSIAKTIAMSNDPNRPGNKSEDNKSIDNKTSVVDEAEEIKQTSGIIQEDALLSKVADRSLAKIRQLVDKNRITKQEDLDFTVDQIANQQNSVPTNKLKNVINRRLRKEEFASWIDRIKKVFVSATISAAESEIPAAVPSETTTPTTPDATPTDQTSSGGGTKSVGQQEMGDAQKAIDYLVGKGWSREVAAGIAGNIQQESGFKTTADNGTHVGIVQWDKGRQANFQRVIGKPVKEASFEEQLDFIHYELTQGTEKPAGDALRTAKTPEEAAAIFANKYERSGEKPGQPGYDKRIQNATAYFQKTGGVESQQTSGSGAQGSGAQGSNLPANDIVGLGRLLQAEGITVSENPAFGPVGQHAVNSLHYTGQAIDLNGPPGTIEANDPVWGPRFDALKVRLEAQGYNVIWRSAGHMNHMHVDTGQRIGAQLSAYGTSMVAGDQRQSRMGLAGPRIIQVPGDCGGLLPNINMPPPGSYGEVSLAQRLGYGAGVVR